MRRTALALSGRLIPLFTCLACGLLLTACGGTPKTVPASQVREDFEAWLERSWPGLCEVVRFEKTNGWGGEQHYVVEFKTRLRFIRGGNPKGTEGGPAFLPGIIRGLSWVEAQPREMRNIPKGTLLDFENAYSYTKTEKGWVRSD